METLAPRKPLKMMLRPNSSIALNFLTAMHDKLKHKNNDDGTSSVGKISRSKAEQSKNMERLHHPEGCQRKNCQCGHHDEPTVYVPDRRPGSRQNRP